MTTTSGDREGGTVFSVTALADDLSGAAETAAALGPGGRVVLTAPEAGPPASTTPRARPVQPRHPGPTVYDCNLRHASEQDALACMRDALAALAHERSRLFIKVDSLLRGNLPAVLRAAHESGRLAVLAPALPAAGRTLVGGAPRVDGRTLAESGLWSAEFSLPPRHIDELLAGVPHRLVTLAAVRGGGMSAELTAARRGGAIVIADAVNDADLDAIARAVWGPSGDPTAILLGTRGLAEAVGRLNGAPGVASLLAHEGTGAPPAAGGILVVVGSADARAHEQFDRLAAEPGIRASALTPAALLAPSPPSAPFEPHGGVTAVRIEPGAVDSAQSRRLADALARIVARAMGAAAMPIGTVVVIGGESSRALLDRLGARELRILDTAEAGTVRSLVDVPGRAPFQLVTRPGSFGARDSLSQLVRALSAHAQ
jgi:4-hydroxythreonine-4-phosphate dehydrogenase